METLAHARIAMWQGAGLWIVDATAARGPNLRRTDPHAHHAIQVTFSLGGAIRLEAGATSVGGDAIVAADTEHVFEAEGLTAHLFIEPESRAGRAITQRYFAGVGLVPLRLDSVAGFRARAMAAYRSRGDYAPAFFEIGRDMVAALAGERGSVESDARIGKVIAWAAKQLDEPVSLADAVAISGLSAGRLRHLFVEQTGLPFKSYLLWLRLTRAVERFAAGASLTQAAHEAGFSDSAHLSRTFRRMFGVPAAGLRLQ